MLPYPRRSFLGYRLLQEYFAFPDKFFFFDLTGLEQLAAAGFKDRAEIIFLISPFERTERQQTLEMGVSAKTFRLNCTPIVNLFSADRRADSAQPHGVRVSGRAGRSAAGRHGDFLGGRGGERRSGIARSDRSSSRSIPTATPPCATRSRRSGTRHRRPSTRRNSEGIDVYLSLVDLSRQARSAERRYAYGAPDLHQSRPAVAPAVRQRDGRFRSGGRPRPSSASSRCKKPTGTIRPPTGRNALWRLISHLSLNYLSLVEDGREALQEILRLYNFTDSAYIQKQIDGITEAGERAALRARDFGERHQLRARHARGDGVRRRTVRGRRRLPVCQRARALPGLYVSMNSFSQLVATHHAEKGGIASNGHHGRDRRSCCKSGV